MSILPGIEIKDIDVVGVDEVQGGTPFWFFRTVQFAASLDEESALRKMVEKSDAQAITYTLEIKARTKALAERKAQMFVRTKNPFTPSLIKIVKSKQKGMGQRAFRDTYKIEIYIEK